MCVCVTVELLVCVCVTVESVCVCVIHDAGDAWHDMRQSLEGVFSRESITRCLEETKG